MYVEMPENDTSIPLTVYGSSMNFLPLKDGAHKLSVLDNSSKDHPGC